MVGLVVVPVSTTNEAPGVFLTIRETLEQLMMRRKYIVPQSALRFLGIDEFDMNPAVKVETPQESDLYLSRSSF